METRYIDSAIRLLERAETRLGRYARNNDDYGFMRDLLRTAGEAEKELHAIQRGHQINAVLVDEDPEEPLPDECYCNCDNAPCNWCETHCPECHEHNDDCVCESN